MSRTEYLLKCYLEENSGLSPDKINDIIPKRSFNSDIEVDGGGDDDGRPTSFDTKELAKRMRTIADDYQSKWEKATKKIVLDIVDTLKQVSLTSMLKEYFNQENQLMSRDDRKAAFALKCLADIVGKMQPSTYLKNITKEVYDLIECYSL